MGYFHIGCSNLMHEMQNVMNQLMALGCRIMMKYMMLPNAVTPNQTDFDGAIFARVSTSFFKFKIDTLINYEYI